MVLYNVSMNVFLSASSTIYIVLLTPGVWSTLIYTYVPLYWLEALSESRFNAKVMNVSKLVFIIGYGCSICYAEQHQIWVYGILYQCYIHFIWQSTVFWLCRGKSTSKNSVFRASSPIFALYILIGCMYCFTFDTNNRKTYKIHVRFIFDTQKGVKNAKLQNYCEEQC